MQGTKMNIACPYRQAIRWQYIKNMQDFVIEITLCAREDFQKSLSVNTIHCGIHKRRLKLHHKKKKPYVNMMQKGQSSFNGLK